MLKTIAAFLCFTASYYAATGQTLFTYGEDSVSTAQFLTAYKKNNTGPKTVKGVQEYLDLYIASRLKIKEAKNKGFDTLPQVVSDLQNLRAQLMPAYLNDAESTNRLLNEAFIRSQKDIQVAHIFIPFTANGQTDTAAALQKGKEAYAILLQNKPFAAVAKQYSADPFVSQNGGDIGYITVFSVPYELETVIYATPAGKVSPLYRSANGYHIFKNKGERKAVGRIKLAQILLAFPPDADAATKEGIKKRADSLYNRLLKGSDFETLATQFSNDIISAASGGRLPEFGIGQYDPLFEKTAFSLLKDGAISKPFLTAHGYHIIKRLSKIPVASNKEAKALQALKEKVESDSRINTTKMALAKRIIREAPMQQASFKAAELWAYTDSVLTGKASAVHYRLTSASPLFSLAKDTTFVRDWITYTQTNRYKEDGSGLKPYPQVWDAFVEATASGFYKDHLENYNETFKNGIDEFRDGNLFFEIMQQQIWTPAQSDTAALLHYYIKHRTKYTWGKSADAVLFYAGDLAAANLLVAGLQKSPRSWKTLVAGLSEKVTADSARFDLTQIPNSAKQSLTVGTITLPVLNKSDNTASFALILNLYTEPAPRSFAQAKSLVINDYQAELEKSWVDELKKKYPVSINQKAVAQVMARR